MGRMRHRVVNVELADGEEIRIADAPNSDALKNFTVTLAPLYDGPALPAGAGGTVVVKTFYGGGYGAAAVTYGPTLDTGVQQGSTATLAASSALPQRILSDTGICPPDRWRDGTTVREDGTLARAVHIYNNLGGSAVLRCRVIFDSEELNDAT